MKVTILDNNMFDDGSIDCLNFWVNDAEGTRQVDVSFVKMCGLDKQVNAARAEGKRYIQTKGLVYGGVSILELVWG